MNLKTYRARSMAAALAEVKKDLGKEAVILHTRAYQVGGVLGVGGHQEYEITAADSAVARGPGIKAAVPSNSLAASRVSTPTQAEEFTPAGFSTIGASNVAARSTAVAEAPPERMTEESDDRGIIVTRVQPQAPSRVGGGSGGNGGGGGGGGGASHPLATRVKPAPTDDAAMHALRDELGSIRRMVGQILTQSRSTAPFGGLSLVGLGEPLLDLSMRLQDSGVRPEIGESLIGKVRDELSPDELADRDITRVCLVRHLSAMLPCVGTMTKGGLRTTTSEGVATTRPLTIALVGPTGVGKTTTIAKLAAAYKLRHGQSVGLVTSDTYRIAAVEQLRTYASIINIPLKVAMTPEEVRTACDGLSECGVILIDTAGRSQHDSQRVEELASFIRAAQPHETHLVLSAGQAEAVQVSAAERFAALSPTSLMFTKLDEAVSFGSLVNVVAKVGLRLSYLTTGQEVPDHIELAQGERLARLVVEGELRG
ncbi:MAG TPA: flagellar biosynthesis protein FlhF [Phycisphaerales bacterium]|nr:flagellar biosynthesis protein FlhF [Phycisphaerales bacterium]